MCACHLACAPPPSHQFGHCASCLLPSRGRIAGSSSLHQMEMQRSRRAVRALSCHGLEWTAVRGAHRRGACSSSARISIASTCPPRFTCAMMCAAVLGTRVRVQSCCAVAGQRGVHLLAPAALQCIASRAIGAQWARAAAGDEAASAEGGQEVDASCGYFFGACTDHDQGKLAWLAGRRTPMTRPPS